MNPPELIKWIGIAFCLSQSAMFSGLNLAMFSISRLRLEIEASQGNKQAVRILKLRQRSNQLLTTILWGNVSINVFLTLLSNSVLTGLGAFLFSTVGITFFGEIIPQAYFSRNAIRLGALLAPLLRIYQILLYPAAKPSSMLLDWWLGQESIQYYREHQLRQVIQKHISTEASDVDRLEGLGALNFLELDDVNISQEGEMIDPRSIVSLPFQDGKPVWPVFSAAPGDAFLQQVHAAGKKWVIITDESDNPRIALDADGFLRDVLLSSRSAHPNKYAHRPIVIRKSRTLLGEVVTQLRVYPERDDDDVIDHDLILLWGEPRRVITGSDILGRLLRGIVKFG
ncbi:MAG: DUF21 domain-containing protein [Desulfohalobiaceae bacterium]|nr:DUF21 domain-containing protein [Desulfohalobiaceae bacterium]